MFSFRGNENGQLFPYNGPDSRPDGHMADVYLVRLVDAIVPEGIKISPVGINEKYPGLQPYGIQMMAEDDDGWAWQYPDCNAKEWLGNYLLDARDEGYEVGDWCWFKINRIKGE